MPNQIPPSTPEINRLRAAAALIPIIESGLADSKLSVERVALMASFCEWALENVPRAAFQEGQGNDIFIKQAGDKTENVDALKGLPPSSSP